MLTVFISDLHLSPGEPHITKRFEEFLQWAANHVSTLYILGDFFHAWPGDDAIDSWSLEIASQLNKLKDKGVQLFFMPGNRDFLLSRVFCQKAGLSELPDPTVINLDGQRVLLSHGDRFCTDDYSHQLLRVITRNPFFIWIFMRLPLNFRLNIVSNARKISQSKRYHAVRMNVNKHSIIKCLKKYQATVLIHGHTHNPQKQSYSVEGLQLSHYILSDWDDVIAFLCYDRSMGIHFKQF